MLLAFGFGLSVSPISDSPVSGLRSLILILQSSGLFPARYCVNADVNVVVIVMIIIVVIATSDRLCLMLLFSPLFLPVSQISGAKRKATRA